MDYFEKNLPKLMPRRMMAKDNGDYDLLLRSMGREIDKTVIGIERVGNLYDIDKMDAFGLEQMEEFLDIRDLAQGLTIEDRRELVRHGVRLYKVKGTKLAIQYLMHILLEPTQLYIKKLYNYEETGEGWVDAMLEIMEVKARKRPDYYSTVAVIPYIELTGEEDMTYFRHKYAQLEKVLPKFIPLETNLELDMGLNYVTLEHFILNIITYTFPNELRITEEFNTEDDKYGLSLRGGLRLQATAYTFNSELGITDVMTTENKAFREEKYDMETDLINVSNKVEYLRPGPNVVDGREI